MAKPKEMGSKSKITRPMGQPEKAVPSVAFTKIKESTAAFTDFPMYLGSCVRIACRGVEISDNPRKLKKARFGGIQDSFGRRAEKGLEI